jgi:uncharacterized protein YdeI (YjbR/CyaY-like superfamily)
MISNAKPTFFATQADFRNWLSENHDRVTELLVGYYKVGSGKPSMTWSESVDQAICYGWIDGVRQSIDKESYFIRFTPRKPQSIWSAINLKKVGILSAKGLIRPPGLAVFNLRKESRSNIYSYEKEEVPLSSEYSKIFKSHKNAWSFFQSLPQSYQKTAIHWVMSAKQELTGEKRLNELIRDSEAGQKIKRLNYGLKNSTQKNDRKEQA